MTFFMQDDFFGTNVGNNDGADEEAFVANESGNTLKTAIGSCSTTSDGFSLPPLPSGQNVDIDVHIDSQHNLSLPPEPEGLHMSGSSMPPFTQGLVLMQMIALLFPLVIMIQTMKMLQMMN